ncbi:hypothetical protein [Chryseobacterium hispalense]|uniref:hypothetical protein n=1 Tax=Chryseobacterium hispalense TaxID=1453492 RepID=UPI00049392DF|nr:hypothetical protein [Chryseobacterium hispalense]
MKLQKVVTVNVLSRVGTTNQSGEFKELEFPTLNKYLAEGYQIVNVHQIAPSPQLYVVMITFILEKAE